MSEITVYCSNEMGSAQSGAVPVPGGIFAGEFTNLANRRSASSSFPLAPRPLSPSPRPSALHHPPIPPSPSFLHSSHVVTTSPTGIVIVIHGFLSSYARAPGLCRFGCPDRTMRLVALDHHHGPYLEFPFYFSSLTSYRLSYGGRALVQHMGTRALVSATFCLDLR
jgi:hypothetical protein